jgi:acetylornithine deacetylase/succinyl-diaminopimelate desuccinylase-like protein
MRLVPKQDPDEILEKLMVHAIKHGFSDLEVIDEGMMYKPGRAPMDHPLRHIAEKLIHEIYRKPAKLIPGTGGSNPGAVWNETAGIPFVEIPCGQANSNAHAPNERLELSNLRKGLSLYTRLFADLQ